MFKFTAPPRERCRAGGAKRGAPYVSRRQAGTDLGMRVEWTGAACLGDGIDEGGASALAVQSGRSSHHLDALDIRRVDQMNLPSGVVEGGGDRNAVDQYYRLSPAEGHIGADGGVGAPRESRHEIGEN